MLAAEEDTELCLLPRFFATAKITERGGNLLDGGAHFYDVYETSDGKYISIGAIEPQFYALLLEKAGLNADHFSPQHDQELWPEFQLELRAVFKTRTRREWCELLEGTDACFAPVLDFEEAVDHPHNRARGTYIDVGGMTQPAPAPADRHLSGR